VPAEFRVNDARGSLSDADFQPPYEVRDLPGFGQ
jgi:hypothetical protein